MPSTDHHTPVANLEAGKPPPAHYYAANLLTVVRTVHDRYGDLLDADERCFGMRILELPAAAQRLYARLIGRRGPLIRVDSLDYAEVDDLPCALVALEDAELVERNSAVSPEASCSLANRAELDAVFARELESCDRASKAERAAFVQATVPTAFVGWRIRRMVPWLALTETCYLDLYRLLFLR